MTMKVIAKVAIEKLRNIEDRGNQTGTYEVWEQNKIKRRKAVKIWKEHCFWGFMSNVDSTKDAFFRLLIKKGPTEELLFPERSDELCSQISY